jgi:hypothetical protein
MTNLDRAVWRRIFPAPSRTYSLVSELVSSMHPAALLPLHRHANAVHQALFHLWPTLHALTCQCVAPVLVPHALRCAARSSCLLPRAHAPDNSQPSTASDCVARTNPRVIAISSCAPSNPPAHRAGRQRRPCDNIAPCAPRALLPNRPAARSRARHQLASRVPTARRRNTDGHAYLSRLPHVRPRRVTSTLPCRPRC